MELNLIAPEAINYYTEEKLIAQGISLIDHQGKINWGLSYMLYNKHSCRLDPTNKEEIIKYAIKEKLLPEDFDKGFQYCFQLKNVLDKKVFSILFEIEFMNKNQHKYCEIVFEKSDEEISIVPRTDLRYSYYLPCDNQQNPSRFFLI